MFVCVVLQIDKQQISALNLNERLAHELSIHRSVSHLHICPLLHSFEDRERAVLVLPLYRLGDARQLILNLQRADTPPVGLDEKYSLATLLLLLFILFNVCFVQFGAAADFRLGVGVDLPPSTPHCASRSEAGKRTSV
jgi:serine/threonine protein kinase